MRNYFIHRFAQHVSLVAVFCICLMVTTGSVNAQRHDYMIDEEIELVRENQDIDLRISILIRMIDRRFAAMGIDVGGWKPLDRDVAKWGQLPDEKSVDRWWDIRQLLRKAMDDIDSIVERDSHSLAQNRTSGKLFPKAVKLLATAARRYHEPLKLAAEKVKDERERGLILNSVEMCEQIIEAATRL